MTDQELAQKTKEISRRLSIYASALPSLGSTGTGGRIRRLLAKIAKEFESLRRSVERAYMRSKEDPILDHPARSARRKRGRK